MEGKKLLFQHALSTYPPTPCFSSFSYLFPPPISFHPVSAPHPPPHLPPQSPIPFAHSLFTSPPSPIPPLSSTFSRTPPTLSTPLKPCLSHTYQSLFPDLPPYISPSTFFAPSPAHLVPGALPGPKPPWPEAEEGGRLQCFFSLKTLAGPFRGGHPRRAVDGRCPALSPVLPPHGKTHAADRRHGPLHVACGRLPSSEDTTSGKNRGPFGDQPANLGWFAASPWEIIIFVFGDLPLPLAIRWKWLLGLRQGNPTSGFLGSVRSTSSRSTAGRSCDVDSAGGRSADSSRSTSGNQGRTNGNHDGDRHDSPKGGAGWALARFSSVCDSAFAIGGRSPRYPRARVLWLEGPAVRRRTLVADGSFSSHAAVRL